MGVKDTATAAYMREPGVFADAFNYFIYGGSQVISPDSLTELDTVEVAVPYGGERDARQPVQRIRDVIRSVTVMTDKKRAYLLLAVENQSHVHYSMPVKTMVYDALQYARQVELAISSHKESKDYKGCGKDEYLSGFTKTDRLLPVITLVIYFADQIWDGPVSIHEMLQEDFFEEHRELLPYIQDYRINLITPAALDDSELNKFQTDLKETLTFIKYAGDKEKLAEAVRSDPEFAHMSRKAVDVLNACVNANLQVNEKEEEVDMCLALQMIEQEAEERGIEQNKITVADAMLAEGGFVDELICRISGVTKEVLEERRACLKSAS